MQAKQRELYENKLVQEKQQKEKFQANILKLSNMAPCFNWGQMEPNIAIFHCFYFLFTIASHITGFMPHHWFHAASLVSCHCLAPSCYIPFGAGGPNQNTSRIHPAEV